MDPHAQLVDRIAKGATLVRRWPLTGGVSAQVEGLELALPDGTRRRVVLRRHGAAGWKPLAPNVTTTEFDVLTALAAAEMAVPRPLLLDTSGDLLGSPFFVMEFVDGTTDVDPPALPDALRKMAEYLLRLHSLQIELPSLPTGEDPVAGALDHLPPGDPACAALREIGALTPTNAPALVHGDFWPGNILWKDGNIAAVIDWEDAAFGDPLADVAGCRLELLWKYGRDAAETFAAHYLSRATIDRAHLPFWELYAASAAAAFMSAWGLHPAREADMRAKAESVIAEARRAILRRP
jgi:aminoglycoside phosphotransferase (APT) family kinase protein